jgi:hypothetical protein
MKEIPVGKHWHMLGSSPIKCPSPLEPGEGFEDAGIGVVVDGSEKAWDFPPDYADEVAGMLHALERALLQRGKQTKTESRAPDPKAMMNEN